MRFIPACAGNTLQDFDILPCFAVHPRLCGEHSETLPYFGLPHGSSPPVRGTPSAPWPTSPLTRFIPACAGNTTISERTHHPSAVHPRLCGEHHRVGVVSLCSAGSSPPVRGTLPESVRWRHVYRFIPACAGNTTRGTNVRKTAPVDRFIPACGGEHFPVQHAPLALRHSVHPRLCGEHTNTHADNIFR